jgi:hypothetical protein
LTFWLTRWTGNNCMIITVGKLFSEMLPS